MCIDKAYPKKLGEPARRAASSASGFFNRRWLRFVTWQFTVHGLTSSRYETPLQNCIDPYIPGTVRRPSG
jgi:hypothetical protein